MQLEGMATRIKAMRTQLHQALQESGAPGNWDHVINQIGMFSFTGLTPAQVCQFPTPFSGSPKP